jgi:Rrf2 family protein
VFTKTSILAIRLLVRLGSMGSSEPVSPRRLAEDLGGSPTYLAKVTNQLARAGILRAHRGAAGGVVLNKSPAEITLQSIVETCQGAILGDFCQDICWLSDACAYHQASAELHAAIVGILSRWTLAQLLVRPHPTGRLKDNVLCHLLPRQDWGGRRWEDPEAAAEGLDALPGGQAEARRPHD